MKQEEYAEKALRTDLSEINYDNALEQFIRGHYESTQDCKTRLLHAVLGLVTEAGELADQVKRHVFYGKELDVTNLIEEAGDLHWYLNLLNDWLADSKGMVPKEMHHRILETNIAKLAARYPDKFSGENALNRDLEKERQVLEQSAVVDKYIVRFRHRHDPFEHDYYVSTGKLDYDAQRGFYGSEEDAQKLCDALNNEYPHPEHLG